MQGFPTGASFLPAAAFHAGLAAICALYLLFWLQLNLMQASRGAAAHAAAGLRLLVMQPPVLLLLPLGLMWPGAASLGRAATAPCLHALHCHGAAAFGAACLP